MDSYATTMNGSPLSNFVKDPAQHTFSLRVTQCFHGAHEVKLDTPVVTFTYSAGKNKAVAQFCVQRSAGRMHTEITISTAEQIAWFGPDFTHGLLGGVAIHVRERFAKKLADTMETGEAISDKMRHSPLDRIIATKQLVFICEPWTDDIWTDQYIKMGLFDGRRDFPTAFKTKPFQEFKTMMSTWIYPSRMIDLKGKPVPSDLVFFVVSSRMEWLEMMRKVGLEAMPLSSSKQNYHYNREVFFVKKGSVHQNQKERLMSRSATGRQLPPVEVKSIEEMHHTKNGLIYSKGAQSELTLGEFLAAGNLGRGQKRVRDGTMDRPEEQGSLPASFLDIPSTSTVGTGVSQTSPVAASPNKALQVQGSSANITVGGVPVMVPRAVPKVVRKSGRRKAAVETIALDDEEDTDTKDESASASPENDAAGGPSEKRSKTVPELTGGTVVFKFPPGRNSVPIHADDMRVLAHGEMLNDSVIEVYMRLVLDGLSKKENSPKVHMFNTFFWTKLTDKPPTPPTSLFRDTARSAKQRFSWVERNFQSIKSWTKKVNIFDMDYLVIPVNDDVHWYVIIVVKPALAVLPEAPEDEDGPKSRVRGASRPDPRTCIVVLDSLRDSQDLKRICVPDIIKDYLECELRDKKGAEGVFVRTHMAGLTLQDLPRQLNYVDCGIYLLGFFETFITNPPAQEKLCELNSSWAEWYPHFERVTLKFLRDKIAGRFKQLCGREMWDRVRDYEVSVGRGVNVLSDEAVIDAARRPRRHSATGCPESSRHAAFISRCGSEPPDPKNCPPPKGCAARSSN